MKSKLCLLVIALVAVASNCAAQLPPDSVLRRYAAQMLMVGFRGDSVTEQSDAARYVRDLHVGSVVLFDVDLTGSATLGSRNITTAARLKALTSQLQQWAGGRLIIAADQEGGRVARLKPQYGFHRVPPAQYVGEINNSDTTRHYGAIIAQDLKAGGINLNLGPVADLYHPDCPAIGKLQRSYGADAATVVRNAAWTIDEAHRRGIACTLKHFPGHGTATNDSHWGFVDVTNTWTPAELEPFRQLIKKGKVDAIMTAHILNRNLDPLYPATLSRKTIDGILRQQLGYDGVVITDDMYMEGIIKQYSIRKAIILAINAGADMICVGNNINTGFEADRPFHLVDMIVDAVKRGQIPYGRLIQSHKRIERLIKALKR